MAKASYGNEPAPIPCSAFNHDGNIYAYALSYDWSKGFQVCSCACAVQLGSKKLCRLLLA